MAGVDNGLPLFEYSLEQLTQVRISDVASTFPEHQLDVGSTVSVLTPEMWRRQGARTLGESLRPLPGVMVHPTLGGSEAIAIRGYSQALSVRGVATLVDGVPMNTLSYGTSQYTLSLLGLNTLQRIELIRGPGSSIYGSDAFHGVMSLKTFESDSDAMEASGILGSRGYRQGAWQQSSEWRSGHRVHYSGPHNLDTSLSYSRQRHEVG